MRTINYIVVHCSATREDRPFTVEALRAAHLSRGFSDIGYHYYIRRDGEDSAVGSCRGACEGIQ